VGCKWYERESGVKEKGVMGEKLFSNSLAAAIRRDESWEKPLLPHSSFI
jgi:hypothetical protein